MAKDPSEVSLHTSYHDDAGADDEFSDDDWDEFPNDGDDVQSFGEWSAASSGIDPLIGTQISTSFGKGTIDEIKEYEGLQFCVISLDSSGSINVPSTTAEMWLRRERRCPQKVGSPQKGERISNVKGHIRMYNPAKGWGFIVCQEFDGDIFLHSKHMLGNSPGQYIGHFQSHQEGHLVRFDLDLQRRDRPQALNVRVIGEKEHIAHLAPKMRAPRSKGDADGSHHSGDETSEDDDNARLHQAFGQLKETNGRQPPAPTDLPRSAAPPRTATTPNSGLGGLTQRRRGQLRMRGLPFSATTKDVASFFNGYGVRSDDVTLAVRADGSSSGEAFVQFAREELANKALSEKNMSHMGSRYIELFPSKPGVSAGASVGPATKVGRDGLDAVLPGAGSSAPADTAGPPSTAAAAAQPPADAAVTYMAQYAAAQAFAQHMMSSGDPQAPSQPSAAVAEVYAHYYKHFQQHFQQQMRAATAAAPPAQLYPQIPQHFAPYPEHQMPFDRSNDEFGPSGIGAPAYDWVQQANASGAELLADTAYNVANVSVNLGYAQSDPMAEQQYGYMGGAPFDQDHMAIAYPQEEQHPQYFAQI